MTSSSEQPVASRASSDEEWVDVRMKDPEAGEWDVDVVVIDGRVEYVDLRIRRDLLASFVDCLIDDAGTAEARDVLSTVAENHGVELPLERDKPAPAAREATDR